MDINFYGCLLVIRAVVPEMRRQGGGAIINQSSTAAYMPMGPYSVSKAAMNALTFSLARELGPSNIRVNGIAPGPTDTRALADIRERVSGPGAKPTAAGIPLGRLGSPEDIANAAVFLLSDNAVWITGHVLNVDGGQWMRI
jgi:3-oxoacyl-[acyl-carrier protein] reductase